MLEFLKDFGGDFELPMSDGRGASSTTSSQYGGSAGAAKGGPSTRSSTRSGGGAASFALTDGEGASATEDVGSADEDEDDPVAAAAAAAGAAVGSALKREPNASATAQAATAAAADAAKKRKRSALTKEERARQNRDRNREHARNTRLRKKAFVEELKKKVYDMAAQQQRDEQQRRTEHRRLAALKDARVQTLNAFFEQRGTGELSAQHWATVVEAGFEMRLPYAPYRAGGEGTGTVQSSQISQDGGMRVIKGIDGVIADTASLRVMLEGIAASGEEGNSSNAAHGAEASGVGGSLRAEQAEAKKGVEAALYQAPPAPVGRRALLRCSRPPGGNVAGLRLRYTVDAKDLACTGDWLMGPFAVVSEVVRKSQPYTTNSASSGAFSSSVAVAIPPKVEPIVKPEPLPADVAGPPPSGAAAVAASADSSRAKSNAAQQQQQGKQQQQLNGASTSEGQQPALPAAGGAASAAALPPRLPLAQRRPMRVEGLLRCQFGREGKLSKLELCFDAGAVAKQLVDLMAGHFSKAAGRGVANTARRPDDGVLWSVLDDIKARRASSTVVSDSDDCSAAAAAAASSGVGNSGGDNNTHRQRYLRLYPLDSEREGVTRFMGILEPVGSGSHNEKSGNVGTAAAAVAPSTDGSSGATASAVSSFRHAATVDGDASDQTSGSAGSGLRPSSSAENLRSSSGGGSGEAYAEGDGAGSGCDSVDGALSELGDAQDRDFWNPGGYVSVSSDRFVDLERCSSGSEGAAEEAAAAAAAAAGAGGGGSVNGDGASLGASAADSGGAGNVHQNEAGGGVWAPAGFMPSAGPLLEGSIDGRDSVNNWAAAAAASSPAPAEFGGSKTTGGSSSRGLRADIALGGSGAGIGLGERGGGGGGGGADSALADVVKVEEALAEGPVHVPVHLGGQSPSAEAAPAQIALSAAAPSQSGRKRRRQAGGGGGGSDCGNTSSASTESSRPRTRASSGARC